VALSNGTSALYLALKILGVKSISDEVIVPNYVCSAVLNAIFMNNAKPIVVDVDEIDFNISYEKIKEKINKNTKAIIIPHTFGIPADVIKIKELGIPIIEDCAQALGSKINNIHVGVFGDIAILSFYATKLITTGQGGMIISKNSEFAENARDYREYDMRKKYHPRFNFQMTDIQAAMGIVQLNKFNSFLEKRELIARKYIEICEEKSWDYQRVKNPNFIQNWFRFVLKGDPNFILKLKNKLNQAGVNCVIPIEKYQLLSVYLKLNTNEFKNSEKITESTLSLPIFPDLLNYSEFQTFLEELRVI
jgi:perosamine synthetase